MADPATGLFGAGRWPNVRFGVAVPQVFADSPVDLDVVAAAVQHAEHSGLDSVWTQSQLIGTVNVLEPITLLTHVATLTSRVRLGTSVLVVTEHQPVQLAKQLATLDHLSRGRLVVGLGTGAPNLTLTVSGVDAERPVQRLLETVKMLSALWTGDPAHHDGEIWSLDGVRMCPATVQRPRPPIWLGGRSLNALWRAARHADGWMGPGASSVDDFADQVDELRRALVTTGRDPDGFTVAKRVYVAVDDDPERARQRLTDRFARYARAPEKATEHTVFGSLDDVGAQLQRLVDLGAQLVVLNPVYDHLDQQKALIELLGFRSEPVATGRAC
jgi:probable F420-dependent oxidoreductase